MFHYDRNVFFNVIPGFQHQLQPYNQNSFSFPPLQMYPVNSKIPYKANSI